MRTITYIGPETISAILRAAPPVARLDHERNQEHPAVAGIRVGLVFSHADDYWVYVGLLARARRYPVLATNVRTRRVHAFEARLLEHLRSLDRGGQ